METAMAFLTGLFFATSLYLMLSKHIIRILAEHLVQRL